MKDLSVFLGANTAEGFFSLYDECIAAWDPGRLWILKGSAGCGKSSLMKRVAERAAELGEDVVRVVCSGDPDSLDGVYLPGRSVALFDGTAPHVLEPKCPGQQGFYLDLSRFFTRPAGDLRTRMEAYREHYRRAYLLLSAGESALKVSACPEETRSAIRQRALAFARRHLRRLRGNGSCRRVFLDAFTCRGFVSFPDNLGYPENQVLSLTGGPEKSDIFLRALLEAALAKGHRATLCPDPLQPRRIARLILPDAALTVSTGPGDRRIHLEKLGPQPEEREKREARERAKMRETLLDSAREELRRAKDDHDRLEAAVRPLIDFSGVEGETQRILLEIFGS